MTLNWKWIVVATAGVLLGTILGMRFLQRITQTTFRKILGVLIFLLGGYMLFKGVTGG